MSLHQPNDLLSQITARHLQGKDFGWIFTNIIEPHPLFAAASLSRRAYIITLTDQSRIVFTKATGKWVLVAEGESLNISGR